MKKLLLFILLLLPINIFAIDFNINDYNKKDINQILDDFKIEHDPITIDTSKPNIYVFYGKDCDYSKEFVQFYYNNLDATKNVNLVGYETWSDAKNQSLLKTLLEFKRTTFDGSPYIVIGNRAFEGYTPSYNNQILLSIKHFDNKDVFEDMKNYNSNDLNIYVKLALICGIFLVLFLMVMRFINKKNNY